MQLHNCILDRLMGQETESAHLQAMRIPEKWSCCPAGARPHS